jgi:hypothetical protein
VERTSKHGNALSRSRQVTTSQKNVTLNNGFGQEGHGTIPNCAKWKVVFRLGVIDGSCGSEDEITSFKYL